MRRAVLVMVAVLAMLATGCGGGDDGDDSGSEVSSSDGGEASSSDDGGSTITTVGALGLDLPIAVPADIPAPSTGEYVGENEAAAPYRAVQIGSEHDAEELRAAVRSWAGSVGANYDESLEQAVYVATVDGAEMGVYVWVRTTDVGDHPTLLEIGTVAVEE